MRHILLPSLMFLAACTTPVPQAPVGEKWAAAIRNYGMRPVYPLREDVFVGDMRLSTPGAAGEIRSRYLGHLPLVTPLTEQEQIRPTHSLTTATTLPAGAHGTRPEAFASTLSESTTGGLRLRRMALPKFDAIRVTAAELGGSGGVGLYGAAADLALGAQQQLSMQLSGLEGVEITDAALFTAFRAQLDSAREPLALSICIAAYALGDATLEQSHIELVRRVFYARQLDYMAGDAFNLAAEVAAARAASPQAKAAGQALGDCSTDPIPEPAPATPSAETPATATPAPATGIEAGRAALRHRRQNCQSLQQVFDRPMAFALDTIRIPVARVVSSSECAGLLHLAGGSAVDQSSGGFSFLQSRSTKAVGPMIAPSH